MATAKEIKESARARFMKAGSLRLQGMVYAEIGRQMNVSAARARELTQKFNRHCQWTARYGGLKPHEYMELEPVKDWLTFLAGDC
jgi:hypothetical protein